MSKRIIYQNGDGVAVIVPAGAVEASIKDVPEGVAFEIVDLADIPADRTFRSAWEKSGKAVGVNLPKAKLIAHDKRRAKRQAELAPLDIEATIPGKSQQAESARQAIRNKYAAIQTNIDACASVDALKAVISQM